MKKTIKDSKVIQIWKTHKMTLEDIYGYFVSFRDYSLKNNYPILSDFDIIGGFMEEFTKYILNKLDKL